MKIASDGRLAFWPEPEARRNFEQQLSAGLRREWDSLSAESDPKILAAAALRIAGRLESADQPEKAAFLLAGLAQASRLDPTLQAKAENRWASLQGGGSFGYQIETLVGRLTREARRPWPMLAMAGAGVGFQISRLALLARWRGPASVLALPVATLGEAALFTAALPLLERISSHPGGSAWRGFGPEFAASLLLMGGLKIGAWPLRFASPALQFPAAYGGVLLAQAAERQLGLRPQAAAESAWIDGLAMTLQIQAGAGIARLALGSRGMRLLMEAEMQRRVSRPVIPSDSEGSTTGPLSGSFVASLLRMTPAKTSPIPKSYVMMSQNDDSDRPRPPLRLVSADPFAEFVHTYGNNRPFQEAYHRILSHYESRHDANKLNGLLLNSGIQHPGVMIPGLQKLAEVLSSHSAETARPYRLWLAQQVYERVYFENRDPRALGEVIRSLADDAKAPVFEQRLAEHFPELDLRAERPLAERPTLSHEFQEFERNTSILPLTDRARLIVFDWKRSQSENFLGNMQTTMDRFLNDIQELGQGPRAARVLEINSAIEAAGDSPFGAARLARLGALLRVSQGDPPLERLQELLQK